MELKKYQKNVIEDLNCFLTLLFEKQNISEAYTSLWNEKGVNVGMNGMPPYNSIISGVPQVCLKVPTGGGKTYIAANAIKPIIDSMPKLKSKAVVWLVPSNAILTQTNKSLKDTSHPYRQKIDVDFGSRVEVYSKEQLLNGQNFNPTTVTEQLSIFVLSYDSFRTSLKDGRKAYQENGNLAPFAKTMQNPEVLLEGTDETALIQVVRSLNPIVIVDESHHATSKLSVEMLENFKPSFILDLTATPKEGSNIISFVDAAQLKKEHMVKLPVIVYNRKSQSDVYLDAINLRRKLELQAKKEQETSGRYIRPIVLFQAQPKNNTDSTTYEKIKKTLVDIGIPEEQIAIKTGDKDELKNVELLSVSCEIRYIITVNALKEGWDCPFAYILATVANRTSKVDVEQILGRVLRLPYTKMNSSDVLNLSYVITSSVDFYGTLGKVVEGLNNAGFSGKDYRISDKDTEIPSQPKLPDRVVGTHEYGQQVELTIENENIPEVNTDELKTRVETTLQEIESKSVTDNLDSDEMFETAIEQNNQYEQELEKSDESEYTLAPEEVRDKMNCYGVKEEFANEVENLLLPQFMIPVGANFITDMDYILLEKDHLTKGFTLKDKDVKIDFSTVPAELARVDIDDAKDATPKAWKITGFDNLFFKEWFNAQPSEKRLRLCKDMICKKLSRFNCVNDKELENYVDRIIETLTEDQISELEQSPYPYIRKIQDKVKRLISIHSLEIFTKWLEQDVITCRPYSRLPKMISPTSSINTMPKSLYTSEDGNLNDYEYKVIWELSSLPNVKWWHRNISRKEFYINGHLYAYPDIIVKTTSGRILMVETKGDHLYNDESKEKAVLGAKWDIFTDRMFRYFMVYETKEPDYQGAYSYEKFLEIIKEL